MVDRIRRSYECELPVLVWRIDDWDEPVKCPGVRLVYAGSAFYSLGCVGSSSTYYPSFFKYTRQLGRTQYLVDAFWLQNFLRIKWASAAGFHRAAIFSISNVANSRRSWKQFLNNDSADFTFNYINDSLMREVTMPPSHRVQVHSKRNKDVYTTVTSTSSWRDFGVNPTRIQSWAFEQGISVHNYTPQDRDWETMRRRHCHFPH